MEKSEVFDVLLDQIRENNCCFCSLEPTMAFYIGLSLSSVFHRLFDCHSSEYLILDSHIIKLRRSSLSFVGPLPFGGTAETSDSPINGHLFGGAL
jgi:hypothetical protein